MENGDPVDTMTNGMSDFRIAGARQRLRIGGNCLTTEGKVMGCRERAIAACIGGL